MNEENLKILVSRDCDKENNIVGKGTTVLDALEDANIFSICRLYDGKFRFIEMCDQYFDAELTKDQMKDLIKDLEALINE